MPILSNKIIKQVKKRDRPLWDGPCGSSDQGGISFSLLNKYLSCKERFRLQTVEGWRPHDTFLHRIFYGTAWHICEEQAGNAIPHLTFNRLPRESAPDYNERIDDFFVPLTNYCEELTQKYPLQAAEVEKWYSICRLQFAVYHEYWRKHPSQQVAKPLLREQVFDVPYRLESGRTVRLRGKWDGVDLIDGGVYLFEHKSKGDINEQQLQRQLLFDLQTMLYCIALSGQPLKTYNARYDDFDRLPLKGIRYNVIRRPLAGGRHTIVRHKPTKKNPDGESLESYYKRLSGLIEENPEWFFMRWQVQLQPSDIVKFQRQCLDPLLENLCDDYEWWARCYQVRGDVFNHKERRREFPSHWPRHYRQPYGIWSNIQEGVTTEIDRLLDEGYTSGLTLCDDLFPELK